MASRKSSEPNLGAPLSRLAAQTRSLRREAVGLSVVVAAALIVYAVQGYRVPNEVRAHRFVLVNGDGGQAAALTTGRVQAQLAMTPAGRRSEQWAEPVSLAADEVSARMWMKEGLGGGKTGQLVAEARQIQSFAEWGDLRVEAGTISAFGWWRYRPEQGVEHDARVDASLHGVSADPEPNNE